MKHYKHTFRTGRLLRFQPELAYSSAPGTDNKPLQGSCVGNPLPCLLEWRSAPYSTVTWNHNHHNIKHYSQKLSQLKYASTFNYVTFKLKKGITNTENLTSSSTEPTSLQNSFSTVA